MTTRRDIEWDMFQEEKQNFQDWMREQDTEELEYWLDEYFDSPRWMVRMVEQELKDREESSDENHME